MMPASGLQGWLVRTLARLAPHFEGEIRDDTPLGEDGLCPGTTREMHIGIAPPGSVGPGHGS